MQQSHIGLIGLAVMGENLVLNMESKGFRVSVFNRTTEKVKAFTEGRAAGKNIEGTYTMEDLVKSLEKPRKVIMMVKAGDPVDQLMDTLIPLLDPGDIIIDGGNSIYADTGRRTAYVESHKMLYIGTGVSGGEEGALLGPSMMPGGSPEAWPHVRDIFMAIAARADDGLPCVEWVGINGAGHFVKMVHNGIEYGDMQIIAEAYFLMKNLLFMNHQDMNLVFTEWNEGDLESYLIGITADIMKFKEEDGYPLLEKILDSAGQKGTGKWTGIEALEKGTPLTLIAESVFARYLSAQKDLRVKASEAISGPEARTPADPRRFLRDLKDAVYASKIISYAQGFELMKEASQVYKWMLDYGSIARIWRAGCIIRSVFLDDISNAYDRKKDLENLILDDFFRLKIERAQEGWRRVVATAVVNGLPVPTLSSALSYYDGFRSKTLPANLLQAQRDYFGAHTYERTDRPRGQYFHTNWTEK
ncbi:MAG: decarboxylating NADP(+)-dependent phosphogluconate dehydrogenase [Bacteroidales bacterium]|nr:decarboxylating NADP(+)-dependent phosphogluconate dehydrogenase [Bacteroidales bacterium]